MTSHDLDWPVIIPDGEKEWWDTQDKELQDLAIKAAVGFLWNWTNQRFGTNDVTLRPQRCPDGKANTYDGSLPRVGVITGIFPIAISNDEIYEMTCGNCSTPVCGCVGSTNSLILPGPVEEVLALFINGEEVDTKSIAVYTRSIVTRLDGGDLFPKVNPLNNSPCNWEITYKRGVPVPAGGQLAAGAFAVEILKSLTDDKTCKLPRNWQQATRQGTSITRQEYDPELVKMGVTGLWLVDSWVQSVTLPKRRGTVRTPDFNPARRNARVYQKNQ